MIYRISQLARLVTLTFGQRGKLFKKGQGQSHQTIAGLSGIILNEKLGFLLFENSFNQQEIILD